MGDCTTNDVAREAWRTSSHSQGNGECVEVAPVANAGAAVRDSKELTAGAIRAGRDAWSAPTTELQR
ncbi:DUF397 domain-containing protein [Embleya sp. NBC_00896]|uniref:DUF397 domain-containing protein n=1 Tax=Embleya sp. NBC_00896 TaxID=2975961 RepID=UPI00386955AF|nr:DUF397 domain-containing protein [Embleya sp. NBC_00896]